jgi:hypothetical protein
MINVFTRAVNTFRIQLAPRFLAFHTVLMLTPFNLLLVLMFIRAW